VTLNDIYNGKNKKIKVSQTILRDKCNGTGSKDGKSISKCSECDGEGIRVMIMQLGPGMYQQIRTVCPDCEGKGESIPEGKRCRECGGDKVVQESKAFNVQIDKGVKDGKKIVLQGEANQEPGKETGDIIFVVQEEPHELFKRNGDDLIMEKDINLIDALVGTSFLINHLDERPVIIKLKAKDIVKPGDIKEIPSLGMPVYTKPYEFGSLIIKFNIIFPDSLTKDQIKGLKTLFDTSPTPIVEENTETFTCNTFDAEQYQLRKEQERYQQVDSEEENGRFRTGGCTPQ